MSETGRVDASHRAIRDNNEDADIANRAAFAQTRGQLASVSRPNLNQTGGDLAHQSGGVSADGRVPGHQAASPPAQPSTTIDGHQHVVRQQRYAEYNPEVVINSRGGGRTNRNLGRRILSKAAGPFRWVKDHTPLKKRPEATDELPNEAQSADEIRIRQDDASGLEQHSPPEATGTHLDEAQNVGKMHTRLDNVSGREGHISHAEKLAHSLIAYIKASNGIDIGQIDLEYKIEALIIGDSIYENVHHIQIGKLAIYSPVGSEQEKQDFIVGMLHQINEDLIKGHLSAEMVGLAVGGREGKCTNLIQFRINFSESGMILDHGFNSSLTTNDFFITPFMKLEPGRIANILRNTGAHPVPNEPEDPETQRFKTGTQLGEAANQTQIGRTATEIYLSDEAKSRIEEWRSQVSDKAEDPVTPELGELQHAYENAKSSESVRGIEEVFSQALRHEIVRSVKFLRTQIQEAVGRLPNQAVLNWHSDDIVFANVLHKDVIHIHFGRLGIYASVGSYEEKLSFISDALRGLSEGLLNKAISSATMLNIIEGISGRRTNIIQIKNDSTGEDAGLSHKFVPLLNNDFFVDPSINLDPNQISNMLENSGVYNA